jgi:hypothetical protein
MRVDDEVEKGNERVKTASIGLAPNINSKKNCLF